MAFSYPHRLLLHTLLGLIAGATFAYRDVSAEPRFGDSTWVAPSLNIEGDLTSPGPRVAPRDRERTWETALRLPFRAVFLPLRVLARGAELGVGLIGGAILDPKTPGPVRGGLSVGANVDLLGLGDGVEGIGVGPSVVLTQFPTEDSKMSLTGAVALNSRRRARLRGVIGDESPVGFQIRGDYEFRPDRRFYGIGNESEKDDKSIYRLENARVEGGVFIGTSPVRRLRLLGGYWAMSPGRGSHDPTPLIDDVFAPGTVPFERTATRDLTYGVAGDLAAIDDLSAPSHGVHGRVELRNAVGLRDVDPDYHMWLFEGRAYLPVFAKRRVIALRAVYTGVDPNGDTTVLPFYRLPSSEGAFRFAGYASQRFRDRQLMLGRIEYRWNITHQLNAVLLYERGAVAPQRRAFRLRDAHESWGGGLRLGSGDGTAARLDLGKSTEGFHIVMKVGGDF